jgi:hypothetical protein
MFYKCSKCGEKKELRRSKRSPNARSEYLALEEEMKLSKIAHLHKTSGDRRLCPVHLGELVEWQKVTFK